MDDFLDTDGALGQGRFLSRDELTRENECLRQELRQQREENDLMADMLARRFEEKAEEAGTARLAFSISDAAINLFEALPEAFTMDEVLDAAERIDLSLDEGAQLVRTYLNEEMVVQNAAEGLFVKTGRKPYF